MFVKYHYVDSTGRVVNMQEPFDALHVPAAPGLTFAWANESTYPNPTPTMYGVADSVPEGLAGITAITEQEFNDAHAAELDARRWQRVPRSVSPAAARIALSRAGLLDAVPAAIDSLPEPERTEARIKWEFATEIVRTDPFVALLGLALGLDDNALDDLFVSAGGL